MQLTNKVRREHDLYFIRSVGKIVRSQPTNHSAVADCGCVVAFTYARVCCSHLRERLSFLFIPAFVLLFLLLSEPFNRGADFIGEKKVFETGSVRDASRSGRPSTRVETCAAVEASIERSPMKSAPDNALWGYIKEEMRKQRYATNEGLREGIRAAFEQVTPEILKRMSKRTWRRIKLCYDN
ncbi:hypothetical protein GE061_012995 [Apolygus lucorum]|uniref:Uncharacterized protein n=1 Tax=Apolygus lucorum TaxID=248454 RepID=A0A8S9XTX2_APOLU|nr:hypothetical protein GE061_012995 [Apolygus lucorum]